MQEMTHRFTEELRRLKFENHDHCVSCGYSFKEGDTSHSGYSENDEALYVCDSCSTQLKETAVRNYFSAHPYEIPNEDAKLWRYMDFTKYVSMLSTSSLYFARSDTFDDHFEGAKGIESNKKAWNEHYLKFFKEAIRTPPEGVEWDHSEEYIEKEAQRLLKDLGAGGLSHRERVFISCWHENEYESEAMWRLYSSFLDNALAIRTSYKSLYRSLGKNPDISIGRVKYIDFNQSFAGVNDSFWRKRISFEHEKEVRALIHDYKNTEAGKLVKCDLTELIEEIFLSPAAPSWFVNLVNDVNQKYEINLKVSESNLNAVPFY
ncbi:hypothetical protein [Pseudohongiella nitratireducens]|uniref:hypothetical protein n=1 Tax=Pseudohongiella nitratireducens TaxID=1768907 RepID=UPI0030EBAFAE|tara:strand:+ start:2860 stop:3816 length:957 start_codon:yes stop_codon:yes gene_type:complete